MLPRDNEVEVYQHLCEIVDELLAYAQKANKSLPHPTIGRNLEAFLTSI